MLKFRHSICVKGQMYILLSIALLIIPLPWLTAWVISAAIHEVSHYLALRLLKVEVISVVIGAAGATINTGPISWKKEVFCALAGPVGGLLLCLSASWFPRLALCAMAQSVFNLLPVYPLDGGRAVRCVVLSLFGESVAHTVSVVIGVLCFIFMISVSVYWELGVVPILFAFLFGIRYIPIKIPCKHGKQIVQ